MIQLNLNESKARLVKKEYILDVIILLVITQIFRVVIKYVFLSQLNLTLENINIANIISIMLVGISLSMFLRGSDLFNPAGQRLIKLNNRYTNKNIRIILGIVTLISLILNICLDGGFIKSNLIIMTLFMIAQPIFEEVIFREYLWNYIGCFLKDEKRILAIISILSAIFQIGYWDIVSQNISVVGSSFYTVDVVLSRVLFNFILAFILGIVKIKYKDTHLCIFVHSLANIFFIK
ncbi:CPBP family intramembrane glutamic endopeptidase [Terrisporobacter sp.]|uniref:CPBP family intramembrane glutamic endopeptidase n=1 Tax=Terrisporobacter sp. TaxID=1965305 RepID=UPI003FCE0A6D